jgi:hypothetical protein
MWQYCRDQVTGSQVGSLTSAWLLISGGTVWLSTPATWSSTVLHLLVIPGELNRYAQTYALLKAELPCDHRHGAGGVGHQLHGFVLVLRSEPPTCASHNERPLMRGVHGAGSRPIGTVVKARLGQLRCPIGSLVAPERTICLMTRPTGAGHLKHAGCHFADSSAAVQTASDSHGFSGESGPSAATAARG